MSLADLYAAILADPDDDGPRLVYADALQAAGDPRGEFVALQCELARLGCDQTRVALHGGGAAQEDGTQDGRRDWIGDGFATGDPLRIAALRDRERALLAAHADDWFGPSSFEYRCRRGFIDHAYVSNAAAREAAWRVAPLLRSLELWEHGPGPFEDARIAQLEQLRISISPADLAGFLAAAPRLTRLREFAIYDSDVDEPTPLLDLTFLPQLEAIDLYSYRFPYAGLLAEVMTLARLRQLYLGDIPPGVDVLSTLAQHSAARHLEILDLFLADAGPALAEHLQSPMLANLRAIRITDQSLDAGALRSLSKLPELRILDLGGTPMAPRLGDFDSGFPELTQLGLAGCKLGDAGLEALVRSPLLPRLERLDLAHNQITQKGALALLAAPLDGVRVLDVRVNNFDTTMLTSLQFRFPRAQVLRGIR